MSAGRHEVFEQPIIITLEIAEFNTRVLQRSDSKNIQFGNYVSATLTMLKTEQT